MKYSSFALTWPFCIRDTNTNFLKAAIVIAFKAAAGAVIACLKIEIQVSLSIFLMSLININQYSYQLISPQFIVAFSTF
jgi:hypothetical protein